MLKPDSTAKPISNTVMSNGTEHEQPDPTMLSTTSDNNACTNAALKLGCFHMDNYTAHDDFKDMDVKYTTETNSL